MLLRPLRKIVPGAKLVSSSRTSATHGIGQWGVNREKNILLDLNTNLAVVKSNKSSISVCRRASIFIHGESCARVFHLCAGIAVPWGRRCVPFRNHHVILLDLVQRSSLEFYYFYHLSFVSLMDLLSKIKHPVGEQVVQDYPTTIRFGESHE